MYHRHVSKNAGRNPIAQAVARQKLESDITTLKIRLYMTEAGEECVDICTRIGFTLSMLFYAAELDPKITREHPLARVVRGGISTCDQMATSNSYDPANTTAMVKALEAAVELNRKVNQDCKNRAATEMMRLVNPQP